MNSTTRTLTAAFLALVPVTALASAQDTGSAPEARVAELPTPKQIVARSIEFVGGAKAIMDVKAMKSIGSFSVPSAQLKGSMTTWTAPPNLMRVDIEIPGMGTTKTGFNGTVGWSLDPTRGPSLMDGAMLDEIRREADRSSAVDPLKDFDSAKVTGREVFEGVECVVLRLQKGEAVQERLIEEKTGRLVGMRAKMPTPMGEIPTTTLIAEWMTVGPMKVPSKTVIQMMGMEQVMQIDKITSDPIDAKIFVLPPAIKALADARDAKKPSDSDSASDSDSDSSSNPSDSSNSKNSSSSSSGGGR